jgi:hypothetical protein
MRSVTENQLSDIGVFYDKLIMGICSGERVIINDKKPDGTITCSSINLTRDDGISSINI